ncbi:MAG: hypothetical protein R3D71_10025 [Rickettsiales bacterium]
MLYKYIKKISLVIVCYFMVSQSIAAEISKSDGIEIFSQTEKDSEIIHKIKKQLSIGIDDKLLAHLIDKNNTSYYIVDAPHLVRHGIGYRKLILYRYYDNQSQKLWSLELSFDAESGGCGSISRAKAIGIQTGLLGYNMKSFSPQDYNVKTGTVQIKLNIMDCETRKDKESQILFEIGNNFITIIE